MIKLFIIMPTIGRPTWVRAAKTATKQMHKQDTLFVVADPVGAKDPNLLSRLLDEAPDGVSLCDPFLESEGGVGNAQRNYAMRQARTNGATHVMFLDDDDGLDGTAIDRVHEALAIEPDLPHFWPLLVPDRKVFLNYGIMQEGGVGGSQIVAPVSKMGRWGSRYAGDWDFIVDTLANSGGQKATHWHDGPLVITRPWPLVEDHVEELDWMHFSLLDFVEHPLAGRKGFPEKPGEIVR